MKIQFYCYPETDPWSPKSCLMGIGGSEEAVINMASALTDLGHQVSVFNSICTPSQIYGRVTYRSYQSLQKHESTDIGIIWRNAALYTKFLGDIHIQKSYLWLHDAIDVSRFLPYVRYFNKVMVLSDYHRSLYPCVPEDKIIVTRNGIQPSHFDQIVDRNPLKLVYGSNYIRGLLHLLNSWNTIREAVPKATLSIFYGWQSIEKRMPERYAMLRSSFDPLLRQDGVTHLGRLGHLDVATQFLSAGLWCYPCTFPEVSCITAMKAQAGGAIPVVIPTGALTETVRFGYKTTASFTSFKGGGLPQRFLSKWVEAIIDFLRYPGTQETIRPIMMAQSQKHFCWSEVANDWVTQFNS